MSDQIPTAKAPLFSRLAFSVNCACRDDLPEAIRRGILMSKLVERPGFLAELPAGKPLIIASLPNMPSVAIH